MGQRPSPFFSGLGWAGSSPAQPNPEIFGSSPAHADPYPQLPSTSDCGGGPGRTGDRVSFAQIAWVGTLAQSLGKASRGRYDQLTDMPPQQQSDRKRRGSGEKTPYFWHFRHSIPERWAIFLRKTTTTSPPSIELVTHGKRRVFQESTSHPPAGHD